jgi:hypothetical protein
VEAGLLVQKILKIRIAPALAGACLPGYRQRAILVFAKARNIQRHVRLQRSAGLPHGGGSSPPGLIAKGLSNQEIADRLFISLSTVKGHNQSIFGRLQVQRQAEAIVRARELSLA